MQPGDARNTRAMSSRGSHESVPWAGRPSRVYAFIGPDGAGKTTIARAIASRLAARGIRTRISWMRSPRIVTLFVIGVLRMSRIAKTIRLGDHDDVITDLSRHRFLLHLYAWSVTFDYFLGYVGKVTLPRWLLGRTILLDRFAWDALVDLGLASGLDEAFLGSPPGRILLDLATTYPTVLVTASQEELVRRKPILALDPRLGRRLRLYREYVRTGERVAGCGISPNPVGVTTARCETSGNPQVPGGPWHSRNGTNRRAPPENRARRGMSLVRSNDC